MSKTSRTIFLVPAILLFCNIIIAQNSNSVKIEWVDSLEGDYSFIDKWSYPYNVFITDEGQLVCDGLCSDEISVIRDQSGRIPEDSVDRYYQLLDTTHMYHTFAFIDDYNEDVLGYMSAEQVTNDTVLCHASDVYAGYSSLDMKLIGDKCIPTVRFTSIAANEENEDYDCKEGTISIDKHLWKRGIIKAAFSFSFARKGYVEDAVWRGKIYTTITGR